MGKTQKINPVFLYLICSVSVFALPQRSHFALLKSARNNKKRRGQANVTKLRKTGTHRDVSPSLFVTIFKRTLDN